MTSKQRPQQKAKGSKDKPATQKTKRPASAAKPLKSSATPEPSPKKPERRPAKLSAKVPSAARPKRAKRERAPLKTNTGRAQEVTAEWSSLRESEQALSPREHEQAPLLQLSDYGRRDHEELLPFALVGIGASAGGLEALSTIISALPDNLAVALIVIQHLAPHHESLLPTLLSAKTHLAVGQATDGMRVEAGHIYVIPPNTEMGIEDGLLRLLPRPAGRASHTPINFFLRSLAEYAKSRAIGVILSGSASDGALGLQDIKASGGITIAQTPETARFDSMPRAAIAMRVVDLVLPPHEIAAALTYMGRHPHPDGPAQKSAETSLRPEQLQAIFALLRTVSTVDFRHYKLPTIERRLHRRMLLNKFGRVEDYIRLLQKSPTEVASLYKDILINVTRFFREPSSFKALIDDVFPVLLKHQKDDHPIRVWISGCATGEEAYSVAIALFEYLGDRASGAPVQIFATDLSDMGIDAARTGLYPESIAADVSPERLRRFFTKMDGGYRINKAVRDLCVFARQDLTRDPPFSKLDLILCRNVLIYMSSELQKKLIAMFHYALKPHGFVMLGQAETLGPHADNFTVVDKKHRLYSKRLSDHTLAMSFQIDHAPAPSDGAKKLMLPGRESAKTLQNEATQIILDRFAPPGVIVDDDLRVIQFRGQTGLFLEAPAGEPSTSLLKLAREGLLHDLRSALHAARRGLSPVHKSGLRVRSNDGWLNASVDVIPLSGTNKTHYLVLFTREFTREAAPHRSAEPTRKGASSRPAKMPHNERVRQLEEELASSRDYLQSIIQELEAANEELQAANEEILSSNEELQSTNEELDTAKEELQSTNEELNTVNDELHGRNDELSSVNSDLVNLLGSVQIAIVIVASDLRIRRFTPMAEKVLNLIPSDIGRPINHLKPNIDCPDLERMITEAVDTVTVQEREVQDRQGNWFSLRIRPYKNVENRIDGAVLTLFDVDAVKRHQTQLQEMRSFAQAIVETARAPLMVLDGELKPKIMNAALSDLLAMSAAEAENRPIDALLGASNAKSDLRALLEKQLPAEQRLENYALECDPPGLGRRKLLLNARMVDGNTPRPGLILLALEDVTEHDLATN